MTQKNARIDFACLESEWTERTQEALAPLAEWHTINARTVLVRRWLQVGMICAADDIDTVKALLPASAKMLGEWKQNGYRRPGVPIDRREWVKTARDVVVTPGDEVTPPVLRRPLESEWKPDLTWLGWGVPRDEEEPTQ